MATFIYLALFCIYATAICTFIIRAYRRSTLKGFVLDFLTLIALMLSPLIAAVTILFAIIFLIHKLKGLFSKPFNKRDKRPKSVVKKCVVACSPSDFYAGGKCDKHGCFQ